jgi:hypothetical protein
VKISFVETMQGSLQDAEGLDHPAEFHVTASGEAGRPLTLQGLISLPPWAEEIETEGTLTMSVAPPCLRYHLRFGAGLTLDAEKHPTIFAPVSSMTVMHAVVRGEAAKPLAEGEMRFELRELPKFLASWIPFGHRQQLALDAERRAAVRRQLLSSGQS